jgi:hypothetical protein
MGCETDDVDAEGKGMGHLFGQEGSVAIDNVDTGARCHQGDELTGSSKVSVQVEPFKVLQGDGQRFHQVPPRREGVRAGSLRILKVIDPPRTTQAGLQERR